MRSVRLPAAAGHLDVKQAAAVLTRRETPRRLKTACAAGHRSARPRWRGRTTS